GQLPPNLLLPPRREVRNFQQVGSAQQSAQLDEELRFQRSHRQVAAVGGSIDVVVGNSAVEQVSTSREGPPGGASSEARRALRIHEGRCGLVQRDVQGATPPGAISLV